MMSKVVRNSSTVKERSSAQFPATETLSREHALMTDVVLMHVFSMLPTAELKICRFVCKKWNMFSKSCLSRQSVVKFGKFIYEECKRVGYGSVYHKNKVGEDPKNSGNAKEFIQFMRERDNEIGVVFRNVKIHPSLVEEFAGDLLLLPGMRESITSLHVILYPIQLDWLKMCMEALPALKTLRVRVTTANKIIMWHQNTPPDFPKMYLGCHKEVPPTLRVPDDVLQNLQQRVEEDVKRNLELETLIFRQNRYFSQLVVGWAESCEFRRLCVSGLPPVSLRFWILQQAPKLKDLECFYSGMTSECLVETLRRLSTEYKGRGFRSLRIESHEKWNTRYLLFDMFTVEHFCKKPLEIQTLTLCTVVAKPLVRSQAFSAANLLYDILFDLGNAHKGLLTLSYVSRPHKDATNAFLVFLKTYCFGTLENLMLYPGSEPMNWREILSSSDFPSDTLKSLGIKHHLFYTESQFSWTRTDGTVAPNHSPEDTIASATAKGVDFLDIFPSNQMFKGLLQLNIQIFIRINCSSIDPEHLNDEDLGNYSPIVLKIPTTRIFPSVHILEILVNCTDRRDERDTFRTDYINHLPYCFPSLKKLKLLFDGYPLVKPSLKVIPTNLHSLAFEGRREYSKFSISDDDFLENQDLLRFTDLREFSFTHNEYILTDRLVNEGLLLLPKLKILAFPLSIKGRLEFTADALTKLREKLNIFNYRRHNMMNECPWKRGYETNLLPFSMIN